MGKKLTVLFLIITIFSSGCLMNYDKNRIYCTQPNVNSVYLCENNITKVVYQSKDCIFLNPNGVETYCYYYENNNPANCRDLMYSSCKEEDLCKENLFNFAIKN